MAKQQHEETAAVHDDDNKPMGAAKQHAAAEATGTSARSSSSQKRVKVSDLLVRCLENEGVTVVVGIPGEENLDVLESLRRSDKIRLIVTRHEQAAGFMAATMGRLTGRVGVCLATLGPGATNLTTAAAFAYLGGMPALFLTGQKGVTDTKQGEFQIVDVVGMMRPLTKMARSVTDGNVLASIVRQSFRAATTEKFGPVHIELPEDIAGSQTLPRLFDPSPVRRPVVDDKGTRRAVEVLMAAERPVMVVGAAANRQRAVGALREFVDELGVYFVSTQMGKGVISERSPRSLGCAALSSKDYVHAALDASDVIIMVGHDATEKPPFIMSSAGQDTDNDNGGRRRRQVIHVNFSAAHVDNVYAPQVEVIGDVANAMWQIKEQLRAQGKDFTRGPGADLFARIKSYADKCLAAGTDDDAFPLNVARVVADVRAAVPDNGVVSLDNGYYKVWFARLFPALEPQTLLLDNALATMGAGLPNALGAALVDPSRPVVAVCGDGGYLMNAAELATAVQHSLNVTVLVLNDRALGMIRWKQHKMGFGDWGLDLRNPDFVQHAESFGAHGHRVESAAGLREALDACVGAQGVHVIEVPIDYGWASEKLAQVGEEAEEMLRRVVDEFGQGVRGEDSLPCCSEDGEQGDGGACVSEDCRRTLDEVGRSSSSSSSSRDGKQEKKAGAQAGQQEAPQGKQAHDAQPSKPEATQPSKQDGKQASKQDGTQQSKQDGTQQSKQDDKQEAEQTDTSGFSIQEHARVPLYLAGRPIYQEDGDLEVMDKYTEKAYCRVARASKEQMEEAIVAAAGPGTAAMRALPHYTRKAILLNVADQARARHEEFAVMLCIEAGKPLSDARGEVDRLIETFEIAAEESVRMYGEYADMDISERTDGMSAVTRRFPRSPTSMVSPFNFPLNLTAHKVAPAIAAGCAFVLKPASKTPLGALLLGEILAADDRMPREGFSILPCSRDVGTALTEDERFKMLTFTGSAKVGWQLKAQAGKKPVVLELGGNAACVVDDLALGLDTVVDAVIHGAFYQSGQSCISVQRLFVHSSVYDRFKRAFVDKTRALRMGNPRDEDTFIGPVISADDAERISEWVREAADRGATVLCGGEVRDRVFVTPAVVENVPHDCQLYAEELFGPGVCLEKYDDFARCVAEVNNSRYGLQAGVYTCNLGKAHYAFENIEAGGVVINAPPSTRVDSQAYGGVRDSGLGREGVRWSIADMTELRVMLMRNVATIHSDVRGTE